MLINHSIDISEARKDLDQYGAVAIDNFLSNDAAEKLYTSLTNEMGEEDWYTSIYPIENGQVNLKNERSNSLEIKEKSDRVYNIFRNTNDLCFRFNRTKPNIKNPTLTSFFSSLNSKEFQEFFLDLSGKLMMIDGAIFASHYDENSFLSPHKDSNRADLAFVLNLSKGWQPHYGGNITFLDDTKNRIIKTFSPDFNRLIVFSVLDKPLFHFISPIAKNLHAKRLAITSFYTSIT